MEEQRRLPFDADAPLCSVSINPEGEVPFSISDAAGRSVP